MNNPTSSKIDKYLTIEALEDGLTASLSLNACEYCIDGNENWKTLEAGASTESINVGHTLSFRGRLTPDATNGIGTFTITKKCNLLGNCMSMLFGDEADVNFSLAGKTSAFRTLFSYCSTIVNVSPNFLPATILAQTCYLDMFRQCTSLVQAPILPATTLVKNCYYRMFRNCISLTTAPVLPAITLVTNCYYQMFRYCSKLNYIEAYFTTDPSTGCFEWVTSVASTGTFVKNSAAVWDAAGISGVPEGWTVITKAVE